MGGDTTRNTYLMQFQSDISNKKANIPEAEEFSGIEAAYMAGISAGLYELDALAENMKRSSMNQRWKLMYASRSWMVG